MNNVRANVQKRKFWLEIKYLLKSMTGLFTDYKETVFSLWCQKDRILKASSVVQLREST